MAILVTGGAGYIGSHVVRQLSEKGEKVIVLDNLSTGFAEALINRETLVKCDVCDPIDLDKVFKNNNIDTVLHFAASLIVPESVAEPLKYYSNNTGGMLNLLNSSTKYKIKNFIFSSTAAVYNPPGNGLCLEEMTPGPFNPYGASKSMSETILKDVASVQKINYSILRYFNVAGADPQRRIGQRTRNATHLIKICCQAALGVRPHVEIFGEDYPTDDGTCIRDYIHVEDLANAHILALENMRKNNQSVVLNVGYGKGWSVKEVIEAARRVIGINFKSVSSARRPGDPPKLIAQNTKIIETLHWKPRYASLDQVISDAFEWEKKLGRVLG